MHYIHGHYPGRYPARLPPSPRRAAEQSWALLLPAPPRTAQAPAPAGSGPLGHGSTHDRAHANTRAANELEWFLRRSPHNGPCAG